MNQFKDLDLVTLRDYSRDLALKVRDGGYEPEHILYVERAGLLVGYEVAQFFDCPISGIRCSRSGGKLKSKLKYLFRHLPRPVTHFLRGLEMKSGVHEAKKERHVSLEYDAPPKDKDILIVDDAIDTGHSLNAVLDFLIANGYVLERIKIAVLTITQKNVACQADFSVFESAAFTYPWSYDSPEYDRTWKLYADLKSSINQSI